MTFDEMSTGDCVQGCVCGDCDWCLEMRVHSVHELPLDPEHRSGVLMDVSGCHGAPGGVHCRPRSLEFLDESSDWIASYVRTRLMAMSPDALRISRHTLDVAAHALRDRFLSDTDAVITHVLERSTLRYLLDGSSTVMIEDVEVALRAVESAKRK
ncbi:hypothetical protein [Paraburkholderia sp. J67]|uniref:hypothetical protein n=1 Tax=Paraburkholderia sp. J67 TaxID=2805435 RepID=UPI002ABE6B18|nr:hypothetical protein [Paraburkholderia sp. J67]